MTAPYYQSGGITIYHGDCREILPGLSAFDLVLTDPPYGARINTRFAERRGSEPRRVGRSGGHAGARRKNHPAVAGDDAPFDPAHLLGIAPASILWGANHYASRLPDSPCWLGWDRETEGTDSTNLELAWVRGHRFRTVRIFRHLWCGVRRRTESAGAGGKWVHPTQKPVALMAWCLDFFPKARRVIDPYMGSGPVARACQDAGREYVGVELVEAYCEVAAKRLEEGLRRAG